MDDISGEELKVKLEARGRLLHVLPGMYEASSSSVLPSTHNTNVRLTDAFVRLLGYDDAASGLRRCFEMVQSYDKNKELVYAVLLAVMDALDGGMDT